MAVDPTTTKYLIEARIETEGIVEKPDVVGAIFGQTEGLLGEELDLRDLQKSGRIGRIEVDITARKGRSEGVVRIPSSMDQVETAIMAAALETVDRIGPCKALIRVDKVDDVRVTKRTKIVERAKSLLGNISMGSKTAGLDILEEVRQSMQIAEVITWGPDRLPAGPNIHESESLIIVEGRSDVLALLRSGIKNAVAVEGTNVPPSVQEFSKEKTVIAFVDGDRGGDLILKELLQVADIDFVSPAPPPPPAPPTPHPRPPAPTPDPRLATSAPMASTPPPPPRPAATPPGRSIPPEVGRYRELLLQISGTSKAMLMAEGNGVLAEVPVRQLLQTLNKEGNAARAVVFDGIITQRILDIAAEIGMKAVIGTKMGTVTKQPSSIEVWTKDDFA